MRSVLDVDVGLPPGLWLPTADEPVDRFRSEVFNHSNHPYEDIVDFGVFATAMTALAANDKRPSFMPSQMILLELYTAGYGVQPKRVQRVYGGESRLQRALGFYPNRSKPGKEEIFERCRWMAEFVLPKVIEPNPALKTVHGILSWGTKRNLLPSTDVVRSAVNGDTTEIRRIFGIEKPDTLVRVTKRDLFKFGAKIIDENGGPLGQDAIDQEYPYEFLRAPYHTIIVHFGTLNAFWEHFGYFSDARTMGANKLLEVGVRLAIENEGFNFSRDDINRLSKQKRFPSSFPLIRLFGSYVAYREAVRQEYEIFLIMAKELSAAGVCDEVIKIVGASYSTDETYAQITNKNILALSKISASKPAAKLVRNILRKGFDLRDDELWEMQTEDFRTSLTALGIKSPDEISYIFGLVPRV